MATSFLLKPNIKINPLTNQHPLITQLSPIKPLSKKSPIFHRLIKNSMLTLKCSIRNKKPVLELAKSKTIRNPFEIVANALLKSLKPLQELTFSAILFLVLFLLYFSKSALAASGGRMGGSGFSSRTSSLRMGGYSSSRSYSSGDSYYFWTKSPSYSSTIYTSGGDSKTTLVESVGVDAVGPTSSITSQNNEFLGVIFCIIVLCILFIILGALSNQPRPKSVVKLQVGLLGSARSLQRDLNWIAKAADTSKKEGLTYILTETTLAILRHPDYCISGYSSGDVKSNMESCEEQFNRLSIEERRKLDEETLVNSNNIKKQCTRSKKTTGLNNEYIVITILVAAEGEHKLPTISSSEDLKEALKRLGSIPTNKTLAVEVLWTPQEENDTLTEQEMLEKYPHLRLYKCQYGYTITV